MVHLLRSGLGVSRTGGSLNRPRLSSSHATQVKTAKVAGKKESKKDYNDISSLLSTTIPKQQWPMHPLLSRGHAPYFLFIPWWRGSCRSGRYFSHP